MIDYLNCYACGHRISEHKDDIAVGNGETGEMRFYHIHEPCAEYAYDDYFSLARARGDWNITERYTFWCPREAEGLQR